MSPAKSLFLVATAWLVGAAYAAGAPVGISLAPAKITLAPGATATVRLNLEIADSYHIYSTVQSVGSRGPGPAATAVTVQPEELVAIDGALKTSPPEKHYDPDFDLDVLTLEGRAWIDVPLKAAATLAPGAHPAALVVSYQACNAESCLPPADVTVPFEIIVPATGADSAAADAAYAELRTVRLAQVPRMADVAASSALQMKQHDESSRLAEKFLDRFPGDPRRWEVIAWAVDSPRLYPGPDAAVETVAWERRRTGLRKMLLADPSVPPAIFTTVAEWTVMDMAGARGKPVVDLPWAGAVVGQMAARVPDSARRRFAEQTYVEALAKADPAAEEAFLRRRASAVETNAAIRDMATGLLRVIDAAHAPLELKFTALDGREVDLAKLRGKVVLIDFWATWCVPCMEEMPRVRAAYQKFHDRGFEVIGISFDKAPGEKPRAMEKTAAQVAAFVQEKNMPWPQHYDGKYWDNELGRRFAIASIPATLLLGKDGRLVTTDTRGGKLDAELQRLLAP